MSEQDTQKLMREAIYKNLKSGNHIVELSKIKHMVRPVFARPEDVFEGNLALYVQKNNVPFGETIPPPLTTLPIQWLDAKEVKENGLMLAFLHWANLLNSDVVSYGFVDGLRQSVDKQNMYLGLMLGGVWRTRSATDSDRKHVSETRRYSDTVSKDVTGTVKEITDRFISIQRLVMDMNEGIEITRILFWDELYPNQTGWPSWFIPSTGNWLDLPFVSRQYPYTEIVKS